MVKIGELWYYSKNSKKNAYGYSETMHAYLPYATLQRAKMDAYALLKYGEVMEAHKISTFFKPGYRYVELGLDGGHEDKKIYGIVAMYNGKVYYECQQSSSPTVYEIDFLGKNIRKVKNIYKDV